MIAPLHPEVEVNLSQLKMIFLFVVSSYTFNSNIVHHPWVIVIVIEVVFVVKKRSG
jgi:hypothetical protein